MKCFFRTLLCITAILGTSVHANDYLKDSININHDVLEDDTLLFKAFVASEVGNTKDMQSVARQAITTCYNAYKQRFDNQVLQKQQYLISIGASRSSAYDNVPIEFAKPFAEAIINQMGSMSQRFSPSDRQVFWNVVGQEVKKKMGEFCSGHGCRSTGDLNSHIDNLIQMKKTFG